MRFAWVVPGLLLALRLSCPHFSKTSLSLEHAWILKILTEKCDSGVQEV